MHFTTSYSNNGTYPCRILVGRGARPKSLANLSRGFKTKGVSLATVRKIKKHAIVLGQLAIPRKIHPKGKKTINHLCQFITLTLCAPQEHTDQELTRDLLGQFLNILRKRGFLANYLWRAEKQRNGNIHYHILTDSYAPHAVWRDVWIKCLEQHGYLERYRKKFAGMDYYTYKLQPFNQHRTPDQIAHAYARGKGTNWQNPPCVQTDQVTNLDGLSIYLSKYLSKDEATSDNIVQGRTWGASDALRSATRAFCSHRQFSEIWYNLGQSLRDVKEFATDYFQIQLIPLKRFKKVYSSIWREFRDQLSEFFKPCPMYRNYSGLFGSLVIQEE